MRSILFDRNMKLFQILHQSFICSLSHTRDLSNTADISSGATTPTLPSQWPIAGGPLMVGLCVLAGMETT